MSSRAWVVRVLAPLSLALSFASRSPAQGPGDLGPELRDAVKASIDVGLKAVRFRQQPNGSWNDSLPATALAVTAMAQSHRRYTEEDGPFFRKALAYVASRARPSGAFGEPPSVEQTALGLLALQFSQTPSHRQLVESAGAFLMNALSGAPEGTAAAGGGDARGLALQALQALRADVPPPAAGEADRPWRRELARRLLERQQADGFWLCGTPDPSETDHLLATLYAILALERLYGG